MMTTAQLERLPKWAQIHIQVLEANLSAAKETLRAMEAGESNTAIRHYVGGGSERTHLPSFSRIEFQTQHGPFEAGIDRQTGELVVRFDGRERMAVLPDVTNVVRFRQVDT